jgi:hypothetical protein
LVALGATLHAFGALWPLGRRGVVIVATALARSLVGPSHKIGDFGLD